jgi:2'-5' RNA ligase
MQIIKFKDYLLNEQHKYEYGCVMLEFDIPNWKSFQKKIDKDDIYNENGYGLENEPHVTLLFGVYDAVNVEDIKKTVEYLSNIYIQIKELSIFSSNNSIYDVLKFDVISDNLYNINISLKNMLPHIESEFSYKPHMTLAYIKAGRGVKYVKTLDKPIILKAKSIIYSKPAKTKKEKIVIKEFKNEKE